MYILQFLVGFEVRIFIPLYLFCVGCHEVIDHVDYPSVPDLSFVLLELGGPGGRVQHLGELQASVRRLSCISDPNKE